MTARREDAGAAVAGLFANPTATGGLAGLGNSAARNGDERPAHLSYIPDDDREPGQDATPGPARGRLADELRLAARVRVGVELTEEQSAYLRALSRPSRTDGPRTLGTKFVATGVLVAAIELLRTVEVDMHGVAAGDDAVMAERARAALIRAGEINQEGGST